MSRDMNSGWTTFQNDSPPFIMRSNSSSTSETAPVTRAGVSGRACGVCCSSGGSSLGVTMEELALTQKQLAVMELVAGNPGASQIDLANTLGTDRATMMALVNRLAARDLIERRPSAADRRRQELHLTKAGRAVLARARELIDKHEQRFLELFSRDEMDALLMALKRIYKGN